ncbi:uncharacterized protein LOC131226033 [Magnolia sinica]|uniref:uncharacterized protein LOC131226033 n=1 Tax=Magnolia sinica TaxID=86752 RepID=UPI002658B475|nr:uncharacterized protein LOC131226033 [Magnolia sinica]
MELHDALDAMICQVFSLTLADVARLWFKQLKPKSVSTFAELRDPFLTNFIGGKKKLKPPTHLNNIVQKEGELLKYYIKRLNFKSLQVRKHSEETTLNSIMQGIWDKPFLGSLDKNPPETLAEFMTRSDKYADAEETRNLCEAAQNVKTPAKESAKKEVDSTGGKKRKDDRTRDERKSASDPTEGIDLSVITHRLNIDPTYRPIQQKRRLLSPERYVIIEEEVSKLLKAKFIKEIYYLE